MELFDTLVDEQRRHPNFRMIMMPDREPERLTLQSWASGFPDRDGKLVHEFQTTFNSAFWEIYLHALFRDFGLSFNWGYASPDFLLKSHAQEFCVEATTAGAAQGEPAEWEAKYSSEDFGKLDLWELNREAIIRLSNAIVEKSRMYRSKYSKLDHVKGRPFVLAVAPFEQPYFNHQYNRPIQALLYDYYVDEDAFTSEPERFPEGPPVRNLGFVEKGNGAEIELGLFSDDSMSEVSAIIFSCTATWGKVDAMSHNPAYTRIFRTLWGTPRNGVPEIRAQKAVDYSETISDGLQVYHNPYARYPLHPDTFRKDRVVQVFGNAHRRELISEGEDCCLMYRLAISVAPDPGES